MNKIESRHQLIRSLVMENKIHTQQELQELLELNGVEVTQSTLSRDIKHPISHLFPLSFLSCLGHF